MVQKFTTFYSIVLAFNEIIRIKNLAGGTDMNVLTLVCIIVVAYWVIGMTYIARISESDWK